jgi:hypothetical protein
VLESMVPWGVPEAKPRQPVDLFAPERLEATFI